MILSIRACTPSLNVKPSINCFNVASIPITELPMPLRISGKEGDDFDNSTKVTWRKSETPLQKKYSLRPKLFVHLTIYVSPKIIAHFQNQPIKILENCKVEILLVVDSNKCTFLKLYVSCLVTIILGRREYTSLCCLIMSK